MALRSGYSVRTTLARAGIGLAAFMLAACHSGGGDLTDAARKPATKKAAPAPEGAVDPAVAEANRTMASGVPIGTSTAPLDVRFDLASVPAPGQPFAVDVAVLPEAPAPVLRLEVTGGEGLTILEPDGSVSFEKVQAGSVTRLRVRASSPTAGTRLVQVRATLELPGGPESRIFAFPLVVGAPPLPAPVPAPNAKAATR
jgi:hypothetical protein